MAVPEGNVKDALDTLDESQEKKAALLANLMLETAHPSVWEQQEVRADMVEQGVNNKADYMSKVSKAWVLKKKDFACTMIITLVEYCKHIQSKEEQHSSNFISCVVPAKSAWGGKVDYESFEIENVTQNGAFRGLGLESQAKIIAIGTFILPSDLNLLEVTNISKELAIERLETGCIILVKQNNSEVKKAAEPEAEQELVGGNEEELIGGGEEEDITLYCATICGKQFNNQRFRNWLKEKFNLDDAKVRNVDIYKRGGQATEITFRGLNANERERVSSFLNSNIIVLGKRQLFFGYARN